MQRVNVQQFALTFESAEKQGIHQGKLLYTVILMFLYNNLPRFSIVGELGQIVVHYDLATTLVFLYNNLPMGKLLYENTSLSAL